MEKSGKRSRTANWLEEDKVLLKELIKEKVGIVENKNTDTNTNNIKKMAWDSICNSFNEMCGGNRRTITQLKTQWSNIKIGVKKERAQHRHDIFRTGGGPSTSKTTPPQDDDIVSWLPAEFVVDTNAFDSDSNLKYQGLDTTVVPFTAIDINQPVNESEKIKALEEPPSFVVAINDENKENELKDMSPHVIIETSASSTRKRKNDQRKTAGIHQPTPHTTPIIRKGKKMVQSDVASHMSTITDVEVQCRRELHNIQMKNEEIRQENLLLEQQVLRQKLIYQKNRNKGIEI